MLELPSDPFNFLEEEAMNGVCHLFIGETFTHGSVRGWGWNSLALLDLWPFLMRQIVYERHEKYRIFHVFYTLAEVFSAISFACSDFLLIFTLEIFPYETAITSLSSDLLRQA